MWLGTWAKRIKVTASNTNVDSDLTHFPLLLTLGTSVGTGNTDVSAVFDELTSDANRTKIAVTKTDGTTELYVEIEKWDDANETAVLWVSKSDWVLDADANTEVYLYYDSAHADNTTYVADSGSRTEVWDSNFKAVFPYKDGTTLSATDSTSNNNDGTISGATATSGQIDGAASFSGSSQQITHASTIVNQAIKTISLWAYFLGFPTTTGIKALLDVGTTGSNGITIDLVGPSYGSNLRFIATDGSGNFPTYGWSNFSTETWYHIAFVCEGSNTDSHIYVNGVSVATEGTGGTYTSAATNLYIAGATTESGRNFYGKLDAVMISDIVRPAAWIKATYYSGDDNLVSWGSEEEAPSGAVDDALFFGMNF